MSLNPHLIPTGGIEQRVTSAIADLQRQMQNAIANMNEIPAGSISGSVGSGQIASGSISTPELAAGAITTTTLAAGAVTASTIAAGAITTGKLAAGAISASDITAGVIAAGVITGTQLSGTAIDGMTLTGATYRTSATAGTTGAGVVITSAGIKGYNATPTLMFNLDSTTGLIQAQGVLLATSGSNIPTNTISGSLPAGGNRYSNSSFQDGGGNFSTTGWSIAGAAAVTGGVTAPPVYGTLTMRLTASATGNITVQSSTISDPYKRVVPGLSYSFQHYTYPTTTNRSSRIDVNWYNAAGALLSTTTGATQPTTLNTWNEITQTATAPTNAAFALGVHYVAISAATSEVFYTECFQMEQGDRPSAWQPRSDEILFAQINASNINVTNLSDITASIGTLTSGTITGTTITGGTVQTATSGARIAMSGSANQFQVYDSSNTLQVSLDGTSGLEMLTAASTYRINAVTWADTNGGTVQAGIYGTHNTTQHGIAMAAIPTSVGAEAGQVFVAHDSATDTSCVVSVGTWNAAFTASYFKTVIRGDNASDFLQIGSAQKSVTGTGTLAWGGSANTATSANITPTGMTSIAGIIVTCGRTSSSGAFCASNALNFGTFFQVSLYCPSGIPTSSNSTPYSWIAWGT